MVYSPKREFGARKIFVEIWLKAPEADEVIEADEVSKVCKITTKDFGVIQVLEFSFIWMF